VRCRGRWAFDRRASSTPRFAPSRRPRTVCSGPLRPLLDRLEPSSAVEVAGTLHHDHVRMYAALLGEEALIYTAQGNVASAHLCCRRSLELYAAVSLAGAILVPSDLQRLSGLMSIVDPGQLDARYRNELARLGTLGRPPT
jgi:hypothetical protein